MKKLLIPVLMLSICAVSCKKDKNKNQDTPKQSKLSMLTSSRWAVTEVKLVTGSGEQDLLDSADPCSKDNLYDFNLSGDITMYEMAVKCSPSDPDTTTDGSWTFNADTTKLTLLESSITQGFGNLSADIISLNGAQLKLKKDTTISIGTTSFTGTFYATLTNVIRQ